eukprot:141035-Chlamydomonas_euryale.AAC.1
MPAGTQARGARTHARAHACTQTQRAYTHARRHEWRACMHDKRPCTHAKAGTRSTHARMQINRHERHGVHAARGATTPCACSMSSPGRYCPSTTLMPHCAVSTTTPTLLLLLLLHRLFRTRIIFQTFCHLFSFFAKSTTIEQS